MVRKIAVIISFISTVQLLCMHPDNAIKQNPALKDQINKVKQRQDAVDPDPEILTLAQEALKKSNVTDSIIVLQRNIKTNSYSIFEPNPAQRYMAISVANKSLNEIESTMYHECGHLFHNHISEQAYREHISFVKKVRAIAITAGMLGFSAIARFKRGWTRWPLSLSSGIVSGFSTLTGGALYKGKKHVATEEQADEFKYSKLLEQRKVARAMEEISDYLYKHEHSSERPLPKWLTGYPHDIERAKIGIDQLKLHGISLKSVINNPPTDLNRGVKEHFAEQIKKWFPEEVNK